MRRITLDRLRQEDGAVAVIVAVAMVVLLGAAAFTIDIGAIYAERAQLQNGADASALAIAEQCASGSCTGTTATAQSFANLNSNDGTSNATVAFPTTTSVHVTTTSRNAATGAGSLPLSFGPILGVNVKTVSGDATAAWGNPGSGTAVLALAFAPCVFQLNGAVQVITINGASGSTCTSTSPSGKSLPGGFGWLADSAGTCTVSITAGSTAPTSGSSGVSIGSACSTQLSTLADQTALLPVYSDITGTGSGASYVINGWAAFKILGWNFSGPSTSYHNTWSNNLGVTCTGNCKGLIGQFVSYVSPDKSFTMGGPNLGATIVTLTK